MELAGHGDLLDYIKLRGAIPEDRAKVMFKQLISAIDYLHQRHIVHRYAATSLTTYWIYCIKTNGCLLKQLHTQAP